MKLLVGIDAGASHTEAVVGRDPDTTLARWRGAPGAVRPGAEDRATQVLAEAVRSAIELAGLSEPASHVVVGAAGAGREDSRALVERLLTKSLGDTTHVIVTTDAAIALEAAFPAAPGIVVTSGSGSIAYARDAQGVVFRVGGLGWRIGDEGSGYALGRAALQAVGRAADGRGDPTDLTERLLAAVEVGSLDQLVRWSLAATPRDIASLARVVAETAERGDAVAAALVDEAAAELALHVEALVPRLAGVAPIRVALAGSVLGPTSLVRTRFEGFLGEMHQELQIVEQPVDPPLGALRLAGR